MNIKELPISYRSQIIDLLESQKLPSSDIQENIKFFGVEESNKLIALVGLEIFDKHALLRSLVCKPDRQNSGMATMLLKALEKVATKRSIENLYLLTTTASKFFQKNGYTIISRDIVPKVILETSEFESICPASAICMTKHL